MLRIFWKECADLAFWESVVWSDVASSVESLSAKSGPWNDWTMPAFRSEEAGPKSARCRNSDRTMSAHAKSGSGLLGDSDVRGPLAVHKRASWLFISCLPA